MKAIGGQNEMVRGMISLTLRVGKKWLDSEDGKLGHLLNLFFRMMPVSLYIVLPAGGCFLHRATKAFCVSEIDDPRG